MMIRHHELKTWPAHFELSWCGEKLFEIRLDDRNFQRGDHVTLREWDRREPCTCPQEHRDDCEKYSGRTISATIGCVMASTPPRGSQRGFSGNGYVVFSVCDQVNHDTRTATP